MAIMLITHDLGVIAEMADDVVVMYLGRVVEEGPVDDIFHSPKHPYTRALLRSIPSVDVAAAAQAADDQRLDPPPVQPAAGLPVPHPLSRFHAGSVQRGRAGAGRGRRGADGGLLPLPGGAGGQRRSSRAVGVEESRGSDGDGAAGRATSPQGRHAAPHEQDRSMVQAMAGGRSAAVAGDDAARGQRSAKVLSRSGAASCARSSGRCGRSTTSASTSAAARRWRWSARAAAARRRPRAASCARSTPTAGEILFRTEDGAVVDVATLPRDGCARCAARCR